MSRIFLAPMEGLADALLRVGEALGRQEQVAPVVEVLRRGMTAN